MAIIPGQVVPAPVPTRRRYGLFTAASGPLDLPSPHGLGGGVRYVPVTCGEAHPYPIGCYDGLPATTEDGKPVDPAEDEVQAGAFMVLSSIECGTVGYTANEDAARVRGRLEAGEQGAVELALWTGLDPAGNSLEIENLSEAPEIVPVADDLDMVHVVAALEDYAYRDQGYGFTAYIHAPVSVAAHAAAGNLVERDGNLLRTPYGSIWVFGGGYPGTGVAGAEPPAGGTFLHITGLVTVWRATDIHIPPVDQTMDRATNQRLLLAEREFAVAFDCFNGRATFDPLGGVS